MTTASRGRLGWAVAAASIWAKRGCVVRELATPQCSAPVAAGGVESCPMAAALDRQLRDAGLTAGAASAHAARFERLMKRWEAWTAAPVAGAWFVPGRIELLGKHTDYAGGRSLLCALERGFCLLAAPRRDQQVRLLDVDWNAEAAFGVGEGAPKRAPWAAYPAAVARRLARDVPAAGQGVDMAFSSSLPRAAGMSSSSAFVVATFLAMAADTEGAAQLGDRGSWAQYLAAVEGGREGVGTHGGSEDHTAILCCQPGRWSQFRFCPLAAEGEVVAPPDKVLAVGVSGVVAAKIGNALAAYNRAARQAEAIVAGWNAATGVEHATMAEVLGRHSVEEVRAGLRRQCHGEFAMAELEARLDQFWCESEVLVPAASAAAARGDWRAFGECVDRSQQGAEQGLGNQTAETRALARLARGLGAAAASAFGAGFGGAVWALVERSQRQEFLRAWQAEYRRQFAERAAASLFLLSAAGPAAVRVELRASGQREAKDGSRQLEPA